MKKTIAAMIAGVFATSVYAQTATPATPAAPAAPAAAAATPAAQADAKKSKDAAKTTTVADSKAGKKDEKSHDSTK